ncbi:MAG: hypothetical protein LEGION0403_FIIPPAGN_02132 [Legionella sp.]
MPQNNISRRNSKTSDNPMSKNQFVFKFSPFLTNLDNDPSIIKYQFHLKFDKNKELGHPEPVHKSSKKHSSKAKFILPTTRQTTYVTNHALSPASAATPSLYNNASSPVFFTASQGMNPDLSRQTTNFDTSATRKLPVVPSIEKKKIKISNLLNNEMLDEKILDVATIKALTETFRASADTLEKEWSTPRLR